MQYTTGSCAELANNHSKHGYDNDGAPLGPLRNPAVNAFKASGTEAEARSAPSLLLNQRRHSLANGTSV